LFVKIWIFNLFEYLKVIKLDIPSSDYTPGKALNLGIKNASRERILILSAHCQINSFNSDFLDTKFKDNSVACIFGKQTPYYLGKQITPRYMWSHFDDIPRENYFSEMEDRYFLHNAFAIYKREVLRLHPFDENQSGKEDRYWAETILKQKSNNKKMYKFLVTRSLQKNLGTKDKKLIDSFSKGVFGGDVGYDLDEIPDSYGEFGLDVTNPIPVKGIISNEVYLKRLII